MNGLHLECKISNKCLRIEQNSNKKTQLLILNQKYHFNPFKTTNHSLQSQWMTLTTSIRHSLKLHNRPPLYSLQKFMFWSTLKSFIFYHIHNTTFERNINSFEQICANINIHFGLFERKYNDDESLLCFVRQSPKRLIHPPASL